MVMSARRPRSGTHTPDTESLKGAGGAAGATLPRPIGTGAAAAVVKGASGTAGWGARGSGSSRVEIGVTDMAKKCEQEK
jgi:hypothetical protein